MSEGDRGSRPAPPAASHPDVGDDANLVEQLRAGDLGALGELARRHQRRALALAQRLVGRREDAEDLVQEAFLTVLDRVSSFRSGRPFAPWFYRILANRAADLRRSRRVREADPLPADLAAPGETPEAVAERRHLRERIERALRGLSERQRLVVQLFELDGLSGREIAEMLNVEETTVRWTVHEARKRLRAALSSEGSDERGE